MTSFEMHSEIFHSLSLLENDEKYLEKALAFLKSLVKEKEQEVGAAEIPNEETLAAMEDCRRGVNMERMPDFNSSEEFMDYVKSL